MSSLPPVIYNPIAEVSNIEMAIIFLWFIHLDDH